MKIHEALKIYINSHHLKQKSVAEAAGIPNVTFNAILNGKRKMYAEDLRAVCWALNVNADTFIKKNKSKEVV